MSEFSGILEVVGSAVNFLFNLSLDFLCGVMLTISLIMPWRLSFIYSRIKNNFREVCIYSLILTVLDSFAIPLAFFSAVMPPFLRSYQLWILIQKYHQDVIEYDDEFVKFRLRLILSFFQSVIDFLCMPFFIPVAISPVGRQVCVHTLYNHLLPIHNDFEPYSKSMSSLRWIIVQNGVGSIIDILCMFSILLVILVPSLWYGFFVGCNELFHSYPTGSEKEFESWYTQFRLHCIHQVSHSITDFSCLLFLLMAILSPLRNTSTRTGLSALKSDINYCVGDFEYGYNFAMRKLVFKMGFLALSDMFLLPLLLPLFLTRYRYLAIANDLYSSSLWGFKEFFLISSQTCLLFADIFILGSTLPFLYLTRIRWEPVAGVLLEENVFVDKSAKLYRTAMFQISRLLLDLILCPLALIGLLSHRRQFIVKVWSDPIKWEDGFTFHYEILVNFMIVFHDVFILSIAVIILSVLCPYRVPIIYHIVSTNWAADNVSLTNHEESLRVQAVRNAKFRFEIWHQFFFGIIDIPFNICALLLLLTGWRTRELLMKVFHEWGSIKGEKSWYRFVTEADGRIRICVVEELFNFIRDFLCLIPFAVLVVTMYRLPEVLLTLYSKLSSKSLQSEPLFDVSACECDFPDVGSPKLNFKIHARKIIDVEAHSVSIDKSTNASLHVISPSLWPAVAVTFGSVVASAARTMLPLKLKDKETIGITDFEELSGVEPSQTLWIKIDTGRLKKSTMLRKINRLPPETKLMVQLEGGCSTHNGGPITKEVLFRFLISLGNIASAMKLETGAELPSQAFSGSNLDFYLSEGSDDRNGNLVNSFYLVTLQAFAELCLDVFYLALFTFTILNPWRFVRMVFSLFEHEEYLPLRICQSGRTAFNHLDKHLFEYRKGFLPVMNEAVKQHLSLASHRNYFQQTNFTDEQFGRILLAEKAHLKSYKRLCTSNIKLFSLFEGCEEFSKLFVERSDLHDNVLFLWFLRSAATSHLYGEASTGNANYALALSLLNREISLVAAKLDSSAQCLTSSLSKMEEDVLIKVAQKNAKEKHGFAKLKRWIFQIGFVARNLNASRLLIKLSFLAAMLDIVSVVTLLFLLVTLIRAVPLLRELHQNKAYWPTQYATKYIITSHATGLVMDVYYIFKFIFYTSFLAATVFGLPIFAGDLPKHLTSIKDAADCAEKHFSNLIWYFFCELCSLFFLCRTYRLLIRSCLYILFVPAACISEVIPLALNWTPRHKFHVSLVLWTALLAGSISVTIISEGTNNSSAYVNYSLLGICGALFVLLAFSIVSLWPRELYKKPDSLADKSPRFTWSHILAVMTTFAESLQLSAVVIYFFGTINSYGGDGFSQVLMWGSYSHNGNAFKISSYIACLLVMVGGILVALPLAASGDDLRRRTKILLFKESPLYDFVMSVITRLLTVWIIATLMRSTSCVDQATTADRVLSTDPSISCGGDNLWSSRASISLLTFFTITSSIIHSDDASLLTQSSASAAKLNTVKFAPLYAITVRTAQLAVCALSMGAFWSTSALTPLIPILFITLLVGLSPVFYPGEVCSFAAVSSLRSAGFISVAWTALVCIVRHFALDNNGGLFASDSAIYIGWGVIFAVGIVLAVWKERIQHLNLLEIIRQSGLVEVTEQLLSVCDNLVSYEALPISYQQRLINLRESILSSRSAAQLVDIVLTLEESVLADRLSRAFLFNRTAWIGRLQNIAKLSSSLVEDSNGVNEFGLVKREVTSLVNSIRPLATITLVSRQVFTILLTRLIPQDVCWYIFEYLTDSTKLRLLLNSYVSHQRVEQNVNLRNWGGWGSNSFTWYGYNQACSFIHGKKAEIDTVDTHFPDIYLTEEASTSIVNGEVDNQYRSSSLRESSTVEIMREVERASTIREEDDAVLEREMMNEVIQRSLVEM